MEFDLKIPKDVLSNIDKMGEDMKGEIKSIIKTEALNQLNNFVGITPHKSGDLMSRWILKECKSGYIITNTKGVKGGNLAFILNNKANSKTYHFFDNYWNSIRDSVNKKIEEKIKEILQKERKI